MWSPRGRVSGNEAPREQFAVSLYIEHAARMGE